MSSPYSERDLRRIWLLPNLSEFRRRLPYALAKFYEEPAPPGEYLLEWTAHLKEVFAGETSFSEHGEFVRDFLDSGGILALLKLAESSSPNARISRVFALETFSDLSRVGTAEENNKVAKQIYSEGGVATFLKCLGSPYFTERAATAHALRGLCAYTDFGYFCTPEEVSEIMKVVLEYALKGHQPILDETFDPDKSFQMYHLNQPTAEASREFAPYWAGKHQELATWVAHALLCRTKYPSRFDCLTIVARHPEIFDLLLQVASKPRTPWFPTSGADGMAAETLYHLLMFPYGYVPGTSEDLAAAESGNMQQELESTIKCWRGFTRTPRWREKLTEVWQKLEDETYEQIHRKFETSKQYLAPDEQPEEYNTINLMVQRRGFMRICILKIFLTMTYLPSTVIPPIICLSILPIAYKASLPLPKLDDLAQEGKSMGQVDRSVLNDPRWLKFQERVVEICRVPESAVVVKKKVPGRILIASEMMLGPTILFRALTHLVSEGVMKSLSETTSWTKVPDGAPRDAQLRQIRQITSIDILGKLVRSAATKRIPDQMALGTERIQSELEISEDASTPGLAASAFMSSAELAFAIKALDEAVSSEEREVWHAHLKDIEKEIAFSLEGAGDAWNQWNERRFAIWSYQKAVSAVEGVDEVKAEQDGWDVKEFRRKVNKKIVEAEKLFKQS